MNEGDLASRAVMFRAMHVPGDPLVLVNAWDVASARVVAANPAIRAIATASWSIAAAHGYPDGGIIPLDLVLVTVRRIVTAVDLPVSVDFEKGYATTPDGVRDNVLRLLDTGAVGLNIEDSIGDEEHTLYPVADAAARVAAVRAAGAAAGIPVVINARTDALVAGGTVNDAIARGRAYLESGADCVFVLGAIGDHLGEIVAGIPGPVSVLAGAGAPSIPDLAAAGVARVSFGPGPMGVAMAALANLVQSIAAAGSPPPELAYRASGTPRTSS